ncbi:hypothetical protein [Dendronalium sp. ChiSLP03b]|uniref:hypothetical protein n=1 Tax=Dendronalium sp. ChiSLP03b TaxID=3075381 RepID=UPI002ADD089F|nr:hypothetical protein [Dendronalium sp. ChiSLP03b]
MTKKAAPQSAIAQNYQSLKPSIFIIRQQYPYLGGHPNSLSAAPGANIKLSFSTSSEQNRIVVSSSTINKK